MKRDAIHRLNQELRNATPQEILAWAARQFEGTLAVSSSFQPLSVPLLHMVSGIAPQTPVIFLDTGFHFPETLAYRDRLVSELRLNLRIARAKEPTDPSDLASRTDLYKRDPDRCCYLNKVEPMAEAMREFDAWVSGIRRDQASTRTTAEVVEEGAGVVRIHPLANWTARDLFQYMHDHNLPDHPLFERGYMSVGCAPCTRPPRPGEGERAGRWAGSEKTECGLHTILRPGSRVASKADADPSDGLEKA